MMISQDSLGQVITFYSYKGGTGRSMALANVACLLAQRQSSADGRGVLMIDWDLEAPGLHRFFRDRFSRFLGGAHSSEQALDLHPGLIEVFTELDSLTKSEALEGMELTEETARTLLAQVDFERFILKTDVPSLSLIKAGCFDKGYAPRVNTFQWESLYNHLPSLFRLLAMLLAKQYQYILIDSRTGLTDISGICTMLMPEKLVVVFTPNRQSLLGVQDLIRRAIKYRRMSEDLRPLTVFPLPSRIEFNEPTLRGYWRLGDKAMDIPGYQPLFEKLLKDVYDLPECDLNEYFDNVQIQHAPSYSYGENVAVLLEQSADRLSLPKSYEAFVDYLINNPVPWKYEAQTEPDRKAFEGGKLAEAALARFSPEQQEIARHLFTRMVQLGLPKDGGEDLPRRLRLKEMGKAEVVVIEELHKARLVGLDEDKITKETTVGPSDATLIHNWKRLRGWINEDREFLLWRQLLQTDLERWQSGSHNKENLLIGTALVQAKKELENDNLNETEKSFIKESIQYEQLNRRRKRFALITIITILATLVFVITLGIFWINQSHKQQLQVQENEKVRLEKLVDYINRGSKYEESGNYERAIAEFNEAIKLEPDLADPYYKRGLTYVKIGDYDRAVSDFNQTLTLKPDYADAYYNRGLAFRLLGRPDSAINDFQKTISLDPQYTKAYNDRGVAFRAIGDNNSAIVDFNKALQIDPTYSEAYFNRGITYKVIRNYQKALADLNEAIKLNPNFVLASEERDRVIKLIGDPKSPDVTGRGVVGSIEPYAKGNVFPVIGSIPDLSEALNFAKKNSSRFAPYALEIYLAENDYYAVTLGGYMDQNEASKRVRFAKSKGIKGAYTWRSNIWGNNLFKNQ